MSTFACYVCKKTNPMMHKGQPAYVSPPGGHRVCVNCYGRITATDMLISGKASLYLVVNHETQEIRDYFGVLRFPCTHLNIGKHNIAGVQTHFRFIGPDGYVWTGVNVGDNQIAHCERIKWHGSQPPVVLDPTTYFHPFPYQQDNNHEQSSTQED